MTTPSHLDLPKLIREMVPLDGQKIYREAYQRALKQTVGDSAKAEQLAMEALRGEFFEGANGTWERKDNL